MRTGVETGIPSRKEPRGVIQRGGGMPTPADLEKMYKMSCKERTARPETYRQLRDMPAGEAAEVCEWGCGCGVCERGFWYGCGCGSGCGCGCGCGCGYIQCIHTHTHAHTHTHTHIYTFTYIHVHT